MSNTRPIPSEEIRAFLAMIENNRVDSPGIQFHGQAMSREGDGACFLHDVARAIHVHVNPDIICIFRVYRLKISGK